VPKKNVRLCVYDELRSAHKIILRCSAKNNSQLTVWEINALEAVSSVMYLAEGVFTKDGKEKE